MRRYRYGHYGRYGGRSKVVPIVLASGLVISGVAAFSYYHHQPDTEQNYIITATQTANEPEGELSDSMQQMLWSAGLASSNAHAYVAFPGIPQPDVLPLTPYLPNGQVDWGPTRITTLNANIAAIQQAVENHAARGPLDLLDTIAAAIKAVPPPATLIVISSGLSTAGGFDLREVGWAANPSAIAAQLKARGLLPDLTGYTVVFSGLGNTAGRQPALPLPQQTTLAKYWLAICRAAGASCRTDEADRPEPPPRSRIPVPVVPVPQVTSVYWAHGSTVTTLPDTLLFPFGSSALVPSADTVLRPLAQRASSQHLLVSIIGTASPDGGSSTFNYHLSVRRAEAVRDRLITLGLPPGQITQVTGEGTAGRSTRACIVRGRLDEAVYAQLRRVVITLTPTTGRP